MLPDFSESYAAAIQPNGELKPPVVFAGYQVSTMTSDPDGLLLTLVVFTPTGEACCLSILFRMNSRKAKKKVRKRKIPLVGQPFMVLRLIDRVVGNSGEEYGRFEVEILDGSQVGAV